MTLEQFQQLYADNMRVDGGVVHVPCCFCAAPDFMVYDAFDAQAVMERGATCKQCERAARGVFTFTEDRTAIVQLVQIAGDDPPRYIHIKRVQ